jgi:hypothetical protein
MRGTASRADSYTFAALLVDEDFVLITAINGTLGAWGLIGLQIAAMQDNSADRCSLRKGVL